MNKGEVQKIGGVNINFGLSDDDILDCIDALVAEDRPHYLFTINPMFIMRAQEDSELMKILNEADLCVPDGVGILYAKAYQEALEKLKNNAFYPVSAFFTGLKIGFSKKLGSTRNTGSELIYPICERAAQKGHTIMFVGGWERDKRGRSMPTHGDVAKRAAKKLQEMYPGLTVIAATSDISPREEDDSTFYDIANECMQKNGKDKIDILFAAFNTGPQEKWLRRVTQNMPVGVGIGVGGTFDFVIGNTKTAPKFMKDFNIEWLYRAVSQPWRFGRIYKSVVAFPWFIYKQSLEQNTN